jgi:hypothetical protein
MRNANVTVKQIQAQLLGAQGSHLSKLLSLIHVEPAHAPGCYR